MRSLTGPVGGRNASGCFRLGIVYFVLAMCLFFGDGYEEVMRKLVGGLRLSRVWRSDWRVPTTGAIT